MRAARKPVSVWSARDIGLDAAAVRPRGKLVRLYRPRKRNACEMIEGASDAERGARLAERLRSERLVE